MLANVEIVKNAIEAALNFGYAVREFKNRNFIQFYRAAKALAIEAKKAEEIKNAYKVLSPESRAYLRTYIRFGLNLKREDKEAKINALLEVLGHLKTLLD